MKNIKEVSRESSNNETSLDGSVDPNEKNETIKNVNDDKSDSLREIQNIEMSQEVNISNNNIDSKKKTKDYSSMVSYLNSKKRVSFSNKIEVFQLEEDNEQPKKRSKITLQNKENSSKTFTLMKLNDVQIMEYKGEEASCEEKREYETVSFTNDDFNSYFPPTDLNMNIYLKKENLQNTVHLPLFDMSHKNTWKKIDFVKVFDEERKTIEELIADTELLAQILNKN